MIRSPITLLLGLGVTAAVVAAFAPVEVAMLGVLAFAGPHNWFELRYLLGRLPSRLWVFRWYFVVAAAGVLVLSIGSIAIALLGHYRPETVGLSLLAPIWYSGLVCWIASLLILRFRERPARPSGWIIPAALAVAGFGWLWPSMMGLFLVYAHPLVALWFLDREIRARHRTIRHHYRRALWLVPAALGFIWWIAPAAEANAAIGSAVVDAIGRQAGAHLFAGDPGHRLIASHAFLELLHYGVWIVMIPMLAVRGRVWRIGDIPFGRNARWLGLAVGGALALGAVVAGLLWVGFAVDYATTRDLYFTVAIVHVLVEVPALIRLT